MSKNNDVVMIDLDRPRELRFGHKALKQLIALTGKDLDALDFGDGIDLDELEKVMYCALLSDAKASNEALKLEDMEDLLDRSPSLSHTLAKLTEAMQKAFGAPQGGETEGNGKAQSTLQPSLTGSNPDGLPSTSE